MTEKLDIHFGGIHFGNAPEKMFWSHDRIVEVEVLEASTAGYVPDPRVGRFVQYQDGSTSAMVSPGRVRFRLEGNEYSISHHETYSDGRQLLPGKYQATLEKHLVWNTHFWEIAFYLGVSYEEHYAQRCKELGWPVPEWAQK